MSGRWRARVHQVLSEPKSGLGVAIAYGLGFLILANAVAAALETVSSLHAIPALARTFELVESVSVTIFTLEYAARLWACTSDPRYTAPVAGRLRYALRPLALLDLLAILPTLLPAALGIDLRALRLLRLLRIVTIVRLGRYSTGLRVLMQVVFSKRGELGALMLVVSVFWLLASTAVYYCERDVQPEAFASIPHALWWGVATLTTIGYGDMVPHTIAGRILAALIALVGLGVAALPAGIIASGLLERLRNDASAGGESGERTARG